MTRLLVPPSKQSERDELEVTFFGDLASEVASCHFYNLLVATNSVPVMVGGDNAMV